MAIHYSDKHEPQANSEAAHPTATIELSFAPGHKRVTLHFATQAILGRAAHDSTAGVVHFDLSQFGGFDNGVSRRHVMLATDHYQRIVAFDLNSYNGSYLNGKRMSPDTSYVIQQGDRLRLGALELEIHAARVDHSTATTTPQRHTPPVTTTASPSVNHGKTQKLTLPDPKPDIRSTLQMRPVNTVLPPNEKRA
jgi:hypothetical protein